MLKNLNKLSNFIPIHSSLRSLLNYIDIGTKSYLTHLGDFAFLVNKRRRKFFFFSNREKSKNGKVNLEMGSSRIDEVD
ncbi:hypothetical protein JL09_g6484 [Pichia kudriavzevii]|uniref:Uncharacterized protein n=1 Tax=Pichia kudriavzevii TaxID=4909 RepID=A0A099NQP5_PICKU|nr:hypothetical protein JL09_g6484 [Pichia kudriavzevii]